MGLDSGTDRWHEVDALFTAALDRPPDERTAFVAEACGDDLELQAAIVELLEAGHEAEEFWHQSQGQLLRDLWARLASDDVPEPPALEGELLGPYRILELVARGGMGTVYKAQRADGLFDQDVAVKVLRRGLDTEDVIARFHTERRILASLEHPSIARLIDGGETTDGRPYLVLEYVEGRPITEYCDGILMPVAARLRLFESVCRAVQHAHRHLVVHRDLKPSNIFVTAAGEVKLLDFGIAKLLEPDDLSTPAGPTQTGVRLMTPGYASPEQVLGKRVTTASDVYQLGLLLHELLAGRTPFDDSGLSRHELERRICEVEPSSPSRVVDQSAARARGSDPAKLRRRLAGDLDHITLMSLRKEPERRYSSAEQLGDDIGRFLHGLPVHAAADTRRYRFGKFLRRHRSGVAAATAGILALGGYAVTITAQNSRIAAERDRAELEFRKATQVTGFMVGLFEGANPDLTGGKEVTVRELLDIGARRARAELVDQPAVRGTMLSAIGQSYAQLGLYEQARQLLESAVKERRAAHGSVHETVARDLRLLAEVVSMSDAEAGLALYEEALAVATAAVGPRHALVGRILADYGESISTVRYGDTLSITLRERAVEILRNAPGDVREDLAQALTFAAYGADATVAIPRMREALQLRRSLYGTRHTAVAGSLNDLALAIEPSNPLAADSLMSESLDILLEILGKRHGLTLQIMNSLAAMRRDRGAYAEAEPLYREVLALRTELYPTQLLYLGYSEYGLGLVLAEQGKGREAEGHLRRAVQLLAKEVPAESAFLPLARAAIAEALMAQGRYPEAERLLLPANTAIQKALVSAIDKANTLQRVVQLYEAWGRPEQATPYQEEFRRLVEAEGLVKFKPKIPQR